jgi:pimeloyl-ACP methyl ester carboxylesterase
MAGASSQTDRSEILPLPDGRRLGYLRHGAPDGQPFFYFHGTPGSRLEGALVDDVATALGLSLIAVDRPGYGLSDPCPGRRVGDWPRDIVALADALGMPRFGVIGVSGGGPYALACARHLAPRLTSVGVVCGLGPVYLPELAGDLPRFARLAFFLERTHPGLFSALYGFPLRVLASRAPRSTAHLLAWHLGGADKPVLLRADVHAILARSMAQAFAQGSQAAVQDVHVLQQPWKFELAATRRPVRFWHGTSDPIVPHRHSVYLHGLMKNSTLSLVPGEGHFSLPVLHAETILSTLGNEAGSENN